MLEIVKKILHENGINNVGIIPIEECSVINERILPKDGKSAFIFTIPYRSTIDYASDGFSEYSRIYDYHKFCKELFNKVITHLNEITEHTFWGFCDHSPINEKLAAAKCGLGIIGRNSLFIDNKYGSFVFLGTIISTYICQTAPNPLQFCVDCGLCVENCPNSAINEQGIDRFKCLSGISQKKQKTEQERLILKENNIIWGCDICQTVCPYNKNAEISPIEHFKRTRINNITKEFIENLSDEEFEKYAFSYKGRKIVLNNIDFV